MFSFVHTFTYIFPVRFTRAVEHGLLPPPEVAVVVFLALCFTQTSCDALASTRMCVCSD